MLRPSDTKYTAQLRHLIAKSRTACDPTADRHQSMEGFLHERILVDPIAAAQRSFGSPRLGAVRPSKPHRSSNSACSTKQASSNHRDLLQHSHLKQHRRSCYTFFSPHSGAHTLCAESSTDCATICSKQPVSRDPFRSQTHLARLKPDTRIEYLRTSH